MNSDLSTWTYSRSLQHEKESVVAFQEKVARLNGKFGIVCVHETLPFSQLETSSTYEIATTEWLDAVCAFLSDPQVADTIWTTTFSNLVRYTQERENLRVYTQELPDGSMRYEFTTWLDSSVYNLPLTLECRLPEGWNRVQCLVYEAEKVVLDSLCVVENAKIVVNVIPDRQSLVVVDHTPQEELVAEHTAEYVVYPNPASEVVHVKNIDTEVRCEVYSAKGYLLRTGLLQPASGGVQVSLGGLKAGLYLVRLYGSDDRPSYSFQIVKK